MINDIKEYVKFTYTDTTALDTQTNEVISPSLVNVCGFVIEENEDYITLAMEVTEDGDYRGQVSIPKNAIQVKSLERCEI